MSDSFRTGFDRDGFAVARQLFSRREAGLYRGHYMALHRRSPRPHDMADADTTAHDPLRRYPRMIQMHRWDPVSLEWLLDARIGDRLLALLGRLPFAVQTMCYFKPPGSRGQALHQDNFYLRASPGTCVAAWLALQTDMLAARAQPIVFWFKRISQLLCGGRAKSIGGFK